MQLVDKLYLVLVSTDKCFLYKDEEENYSTN